MTSVVRAKAQSVADPVERQLFAAVELPASPDRVFQALASREVTDWWIRPGVFDTREWNGDVRTGGRWQASGVAQGRPYALEGEFLEIDAPRTLVHTWHGVGTPDAPTTVTYFLDEAGGGTRLTLRHAGFPSREACENHRIGWETSLDRLAELLG